MLIYYLYIQVQSHFLNNPFDPSVYRQTPQTLKKNTYKYDAHAQANLFEIKVKYQNISLMFFICKPLLADLMSQCDHHVHHCHIIYLVLRANILLLGLFLMSVRFDTIVFLLRQSLPSNTVPTVDSL